MKKNEFLTNKSIFKKIFVQICRLVGFEIIDQNKFYSPSLNKNLNENLTSQGKKSIVLPLGEVKITRKVRSILIIFRSCTDVHIWSQNKKRIFEAPKQEYTLRCLNSLIKSISQAKKLLTSVDFKIIVVDENSKKEIVEKIILILKSSKIQYSFVNLDKSEFKNLIEEKNNQETFSNLSSLYKCYLLAKEKAKDLILFIEDDYLHLPNVITEMILTYERISSQLNREIFICPADYPYLYTKHENTNIFIGNSIHWRRVNQSLCSFLTSKLMLNKYWKNFTSTCEKANDPFEKHFHKIYELEYCLSPIPSLSIHLTNINSSYGLSPHIDWQKIWENNKKY